MNVKRNEIYYANLDPVKGSEQCGIRPVLIIQNNKGNKHSPTTIVAAITSKVRKRWLPTHVPLKAVGLPVKSLVLLEHIFTIDETRIVEYVGVIDKETMVRVEKALKISVGLKK